MTEIRHKVPGGSEEVESTEIHIPDDTEIGTGEFILTLKPDALPAPKVFWSTIIHPPKLQVSATFDTGGNVLIQLGLADGIDKNSFRLPAAIVPKQVYKVRLRFSNWKITDAFLDGGGKKTKLAKL